MSEIEECLFCKENASYEGKGPLDQTYEVNCPNCGIYRISSKVKIGICDDYTSYAYLISGLIREKNNLGLTLEVITSDNILSLISDPLIPKTLMQRLDKIILYFYSQTSYFGEDIFIDNEKYSIAYAKKIDELNWFIQLLIQEGYLSRSLSLTFKGWERAEKLISTNNYSNKVFVAMGFKEDLLEAHEKAIKTACKECGFNSLLISEKEHNEGITDRIIAEIKTSKFMITDFTYNNCGAYFEAGYAQGRGLEVIRTCKKEWFDGEDENGNKNHVHFDINHYNFIIWKDYNDLKEKLINRIRATIL